MSEEELNKDYLKNRLKSFRVSNKLLNEILDINSQEYIKGLIQGKFDAQMTISEVIKRIEEAIDFWEEDVPVDILKDIKKDLSTIWN